MSHFVTMRAEIRERQLLMDALRDLAVPFEEGPSLFVKGDGRRVERAELVARPAPGCEVGFRRERDEYEIVADWYSIERQSTLRRDAFVGELRRRYAYRAVLAQAREEDLIIEEERLENGDIVLVLSEKG